jgi:hypothetical protein
MSGKRSILSSTDFSSYVTNLLKRIESGSNKISEEALVSIDSNNKVENKGESDYKLVSPIAERPSVTEHNLSSSKLFLKIVASFK